MYFYDPRIMKSLAMFQGITVPGPWNEVDPNPRFSEEGYVSACTDRIESLISRHRKEGGYVLQDEIEASGLATRVEGWEDMIRVWDAHQLFAERAVKVFPGIRYVGRLLSSRQDPAVLKRLMDEDEDMISEAGPLENPGDPVSREKLASELGLTNTLEMLNTIAYDLGMEDEDAASAQEAP